MKLFYFICIHTAQGSRQKKGGRAHLCVRPNGVCATPKDFNPILILVAVQTLSPHILVLVYARLDIICCYACVLSVLLNYEEMPLAKAMRAMDKIWE